jgi:hypothetical protein|tara:strand:+ start:4419 stop:4520 length:102 start_codon:yes stop_codon:yes gene_type:complete
VEAIRFEVMKVSEKRVAYFFDNDGFKWQFEKMI